MITYYKSMKLFNQSTNKKLLKIVQVNIEKKTSYHFVQNNI